MGNPVNGSLPSNVLGQLNFLQIPLSEAHGFSLLGPFLQCTVLHILPFHCKYFLQCAMVHFCMHYRTVRMARIQLCVGDLQTLYSLHSLDRLLERKLGGRATQIYLQLKANSYHAIYVNSVLGQGNLSNIAQFTENQQILQAGLSTSVEGKYSKAC